MPTVSSRTLQQDSTYIRERIRTVPDWPQTGVQFRDITPLLQDPETFHVLMDIFIRRYGRNSGEQNISLVAGIDARGFILGAVLAHQLKLPFIPIRKKGKLPFDTITEEYELEYGTGSLEIHSDACRAGDRALLIDDLIATGGTMLAGVKLLERLGATLVECAAIIDLPELGGSKRIRDAGHAAYAVCAFEGH